MSVCLSVFLSSLPVCPNHCYFPVCYCPLYLYCFFSNIAFRMKLERRFPESEGVQHIRHVQYSIFNAVSLSKKTRQMRPPSWRRLFGQTSPHCSGISLCRFLQLAMACVCSAQFSNRQATFGLSKQWELMTKLRECDVCTVQYVYNCAKGMKLHTNFKLVLEHNCSQGRSSKLSLKLLWSCCF